MPNLRDRKSMNLPRELCRHFGVCGGCLYQDVPYEEQLARKAAWLEELLREYWQGPVPVIASPVLFHYRNKIDPGFALKRYPEPPPRDFPRETVLGFKQREGWRWPMDIRECRIGPEGVDGLLRSVHEWRNASGLAAYDSRRGTGYLRNLLVRDAKRTGERMVVLITAPGVLPDADAFVFSVQKYFEAASIVHGEFSGKAEVATAEKVTLLHGRPWITETLHLDAGAAAGTFTASAVTPSEFIQDDTRTFEPLGFRISPMSFFQTNPLAAERLYGVIREWARRVRPARLYDLYGGAGGIAFSCAGCAGDIVSVENVEVASEDGRFNAEQNGIENVSFVTDSVRAFTRKLLAGGGMPADSAVVVDPPRSGMHPKSLLRLLEMKPQNILYVSCNAAKLKEELAVLTRAYEVTDVRGVDMFPHTPHVEVVAALAPKADAS